MLEFTLDVSSLSFLSGAFAWIRNLKMILIMLLADFTTLKGANFGILLEQKKSHRSFPPIWPMALKIEKMKNKITKS